MRPKVVLTKLSPKWQCSRLKQCLICSCCIFLPALAGRLVPLSRSVISVSTKLVFCLKQALTDCYITPVCINKDFNLNFSFIKFEYDIHGQLISRDRSIITLMLSLWKITVTFLQCMFVNCIFSYNGSWARWSVSSNKTFQQDIYSI